MLDTIRRNPSLKIMTEFAPDILQESGCSPEGFLEKLTDCGFKLYIIDEKTETIKLADFRGIMKTCKKSALNMVNLYCGRL